jgi:hypothetical protein
MVFACFVYVVHVGHEIDDEDVGTFTSRYARDDLEALARDREARWRSAPPTGFRRFSREDQYLDEGLWHVRRRNRAWTDGDVARAWGENLILEKYFKPVLDTPTYTSMVGHRWPAEQRVDAGRRRGPGGAPAFVSDAEPYPILTWPHAVYWAAIFVPLAGVAAGTALLERRARTRERAAGSETSGCPR